MNGKVPRPGALGQRQGWRVVQLELPGARLEAIDQHLVAPQVGDQGESVGGVEIDEVGMGPAVLDMATAQCSYNAPEYLLSYIAIIEMSHFYNLPNWGYAGTTVLKDGFKGWQAAGLPTASGAAATQIVYQKKLAPGAIDPQEFVALQGDADPSWVCYLSAEK